MCIMYTLLLMWEIKFNCEMYSREKYMIIIQHCLSGWMFYVLLVFKFLDYSLNQWQTKVI